MEQADERAVELADGDLDQLRQAAEQVVAALLRLIESIQEFVAEVVQRVYTALDRWLEQWRRLYLAARLRRWRVPERVALWIAGRWPRRWLPALPGCSPGA